jgi:hypothetical protein
MSDIRKLIDTINEMATTSGSVASVASPMGGVKSRKKDSIFYEGSKCTSCGCEPCKCEETESNTVDGTKTPDAPNVSQFGLWKNSALIGQEQREKKKKSVKESKKSVPYEGDREYNALDAVQDKIAKMAHRHKDEVWTKADYERLGKRLAQSSKSKLDELGNSLMPGGQRKLRLAQETFVDPRASRRHPGAVDVAESKKRNFIKLHDRLVDLDDVMFDGNEYDKPYVSMARYDNGKRLNTVELSDLNDLYPNFYSELEQGLTPVMSGIIEPVVLKRKTRESADMMESRPSDEKILRLFTGGKSPEAIADALGIDIDQVKDYINNRMPGSQDNRSRGYSSGRTVGQGMNEEYNGEYDDEAGMAYSSLHTITRAAEELLDTIESDDNLPEWAQEKISNAEMMLSDVRDYLMSEQEQGIDPKQVR